MPIIPALERLRQEDLEFEESLSYLSSETLWCDKSKLWSHWNIGGLEGTKGLLEISYFLISDRYSGVFALGKLSQLNTHDLERCQASQHM